VCVCVYVCVCVCVSLCVSVLFYVCEVVLASGRDNRVEHEVWWLEAKQNSKDVDTIDQKAANAYLEHDY
jgi:hypothetical protein